MNKSKFIYPKMDIHIFSCELITTDSTADPTAQGSYAAGALADYVTGQSSNGNAAGRQITTLKNLFEYNY
ncbi:MAG: hypothetical protein ACI4EA_07065 [Candidatus Ornithomonoglobus sp.]